jgi:hypothetical protein
MTPKELLAQLAAQREQIAALILLWEELFPEFPQPGNRQFQTWLRMYDFDTVIYGMNAAMQLCNKRATKTVEGDAVATHMGPPTVSDVIQYASGCMKKQKKEQVDGGQ